MDFAYIFRVLFKKKWLIISAAILAAAIAWFLTQHEKMNYRSSSRISTGFSDPERIDLYDGPTSGYDAELKFNNAITTWTSPSVVNLLCYQLILHDLKSDQPFRRLNDAQLQSDAYKRINKTEAINLFENKLASMTPLTSYKPEEKKLLELLNAYGYNFANITSHMAIFQVPRTDYIQIDFVSEHPDLSAFVVNNIYQQFIRYYKTINSTISQESLDTLKSIMDKKKLELDIKYVNLRQAGYVDPTVQNTSTFDLIATMEKDLSTERGRRTDNQFELRKVEQKLAALGGGNDNDNSNNNQELITARKVMNDTYSEYLKTGDAALLTKYNLLRNEYTQKYANSRTPITNEPEKNRSKLLDQKNDLIVDLEANDVKIRSIERNISILKGTASNTFNQGANIETLKEDAKMMEREYFDAKQKYSLAFDKSSTAVNNFRQLQIAQPAIAPEPSKRKIIVAMAGVATMLTSVLIIVLLAYLDSSVKTPVIFSKMVNLKLISMVNFMNLKHKDLKMLVTGHLKEQNRAEKNRSNIFRESIRKLRYEIERSGKKVFLFTSTKKGQGKTTLIQALSYSLSLSKKKILIIDTNFCNNDLTVQMEANPVLEQISANGVSSQTLIQKINEVSKNIGEEGNIFVIGSEGGDYTPSEILPRENILQHLGELANDFDYIFLEGPPLNDFSDSKELVQYVDGVVGIFSAKHIIKQIDKESIIFYKELDGKFIGSVLNMVDLENVNTI
jgi:polysaccharide biosynthesis transport protein